jgi:hypothetical protein
MPAVAPPTAAHSCPRCRGRLSTAQDWAGTYSSCLLCGYVYEWGALPAQVAAAAVADADHPAPHRRLRSPSHGLHGL